MRFGRYILLACLWGAALSGSPIYVNIKTTGQPAFYLDEAHENPVPAGFYAELILSAIAEYNPEEADDYLILDNISQDGFLSATNSVRMGYGEDGSFLGDGMIGLSWCNTNVQSGAYIALRFYDDTIKYRASAYGVSPFIELKRSGSPNGNPHSENHHWNGSSNPADHPDIPYVSNPEPASVSLFITGGLALLFRRRLRRV